MKCSTMRWIPTSLGGLRIAHVNMGNGRSRFGGLEAGRGDLRRRHGKLRMFPSCIARTGHRACNDDFSVHVDPYRHFKVLVLLWDQRGRHGYWITV